MRTFLFISTILCYWIGFGQASSQMNNLLNVDALISPPNIVFTLPAPASTWQQTSITHLRLPIGQITNLQTELDNRLTIETDPQFDTKLAGKTTANLAEGSNLYFTTARARSSISAGNELSYNSSTGVISKAKRQEPLTGTTNVSGLVTFTFLNTYSTVPNIQYQMGFGANIKDTIILNSAPTTTTATFLVQVRNDVLGILPTYSNVPGREVNILVTEK